LLLLLTVLVTVNKATFYLNRKVIIQRNLFKKVSKIINLLNVNKYL